MSVIDLLLLALGGYFVVRGLMRGFSGELFSLLGIVGSFYGSMKFGTPVARFLSAKLGFNPLVCATVSIVVIFLAILLCCEILGKRVKKLISAAKLSKLDAALGGTAGALKFTLVVLTILVAAVIVVPITGNGWVCNSKVLSSAARALPVVYPTLEKIGVAPNLEDLRRDAVKFITTRSLRMLTERAASGTEPNDGDARARKMARALGASEDSETREKSGDKSYRERAMEFFLGSRKDKNHNTESEIE